VYYTTHYTEKQGFLETFPKILAFPYNVLYNTLKVSL